MKKELFDFLWKIIDKFGFPVLGAFLLSIASLVLKPEQCIKVVPFPDNKIYWACAILTIAYTLIIAFLRTVWNNKQQKRHLKNYQEANTKEEYTQTLYDLWADVDALSEEDRADIREFLKTGNKAVAKNERFLPYNSLYRTNWVVGIAKHTTEDVIEMNHATGQKEVFTKVNTHMYKLTDNMYKLLKHSQDNFGRICNFDE